MLQDKDAKNSERVMKGILQMTKPDIKTLKQAYEGQYTAHGTANDD
jgi:hypothetical protein